MQILVTSASYNTLIFIPSSSHPFNLLYFVPICEFCLKPKIFPLNIFLTFFTSIIFLKFINFVNIWTREPLSLRKVWKRLFYFSITIKISILNFVYQQHWLYEVQRTNWLNSFYLIVFIIKSFWNSIFK